MPLQTEDPTAALSRLCTDVADVIRGYDEMEGRADADLHPIVQRLHALHERHAADLMNTLETMGGHPEDSGSMMGAVHAAVAAARDWFDRLDTSALPQIVDGEERLIQSYDDAIETMAEHHAARDLLVDQRAALRNQVDALSDG